MLKFGAQSFAADLIEHRKRRGNQRFSMRLKTKAESLFKPHPTKNPCGIVLETAIVHDAQHSVRQITQPVVMIDQFACTEPNCQRIDCKITPKKVIRQRSRHNCGKCARMGIGFASRRHEIDKWRLTSTLTRRQ